MRRPWSRSWKWMNPPKILQLSPSVFTHLFLPVCPRSVDWHQAENSHLVPVDASDYWNPHLDLRCVPLQNRLWSGLSCCAYPPENLINPLNDRTLEQLRDSWWPKEGATNPLIKVHCDFSAKSTDRREEANVKVTAFLFWKSNEANEWEKEIGWDQCSTV